MKMFPLLLALALPSLAEHGLPEMARGREAGIRFMGCEVLSLSRILSEASARLQLVDAEAAYLRNEAREFSAEWRAWPAETADRRQVRLGGAFTSWRS